MSNIPKARELLLELANSLRNKTTAAHIRRIVVGYMVREKQARRAPNQSDRITPHMKAQIVREVASGYTLAQIAHMHNINPGRVSEIIHGKR